MEGNFSMKKRILAVSLVVLAGGIAVFFLVRANRTIQQQQQALRQVSAKVDRLERAAAAAHGSLVPGDELLAASPRNFVENTAVSPESSRDLKAEVDRLSQTVAKLQAQLDAAQRAPLVQFDQNGQNGPGVNRHFNIPTNGVVIPSPPVSGQVPKSWIPFEFNGATYYTVPLALTR
jgi:cell division protein FtsB